MSAFPEYKTASVSSLIPYARNSRTHSAEQVSKITASIKEFGFLNPVIVDGESGIIAGHGRVMAAQKLGMETVPVIEASHLTDAQRRAYIIADNRLALDAGWDEEMLRVEFAELGDLGFDLDLTGFELEELDDLKFGEEDGPELSEKYTNKIQTPIYEIKGKQPGISEIFCRKKTDDLISSIELADIPDDIKQFLIAAANRHTVFNYENIAEFYAHQCDKVKALMEDSALVIVDFNKAIEQGYVKLTDEIVRLAGESENE